MLENFKGPFSTQLECHGVDPFRPAATDVERTAQLRDLLAQSLCPNVRDPSVRPGQSDEQQRESEHEPDIFESEDFHATIVLIESRRAEPRIPTAA